MPTEPRRLLVLVPTLAHGGGERVAANLVTALDSAPDTELHVALFAASATDFPIPASVQVHTLDESLGRSHLTSRAWHLYRKVLKVRRLLRRVKPDAVLAIMSSMNVIALLADGGRTPTLISEHGFVMRGAPYLARQAHHLFVKRLYPRASRVVAVSEGLRSELLSLNPALDIAVIHNPVYTEDVARRSLESVAGLPGRYVLGVGRLVRTKGFDLLLRAFAQLKERDLNLVILGDGPEREHLEALADELGVRDRLLLPGFHSNPYAWMRHSACFVLSSRSEGFGMVLVEALASRANVVAFDCPSGPREILRGGSLGRLVPPGDIVQLSTAIKEAMQAATGPTESELLSALAAFEPAAIASKYRALLRT